MDTKPQYIVIVPSSDWVPSDILVWTEPTSKSTTASSTIPVISTNGSQGLSDHHMDAQIHTKCHLHQLQAF